MEGGCGAGQRRRRADYVTAQGGDAQGRGGGAGSGGNEGQLARHGLLRRAGGGGATANGWPRRSRTRPAAAEAQGAARRARVAGGTRALPPPRTLPAEAAAAAAEAKATRAERVAEALVAEMAGLAQVRRDVMRSRRQGRLDDALVVS